MLGEENIFDVPYSLPSSAHSLAFSNRTPTALNKIQNSKHMPDYGGNLEVPGTRTKQYRLRQGIPFDTNPHYVRVICASNEAKDHKFDTANNIVITSYLNYHRDEGPESFFSVFRALGANLYFNAIQRIPIDFQPVHRASTYAHIPYSHDINGLKYCDSLDKYLVVKFDRGLKLIHLNKSYKLPKPSDQAADENEEQSTNTVDIADPHQSVFDFVGSFAARRDFHMQDACLSTNQKYLASTSSDDRDIEINLYDISRSRKCYKTIVKSRDDNVQLAHQTTQSVHGIKKKSGRSYVPIKTSFEELRQIENDPGHIIHLALTTTNRVAAIDTRSDSIQKNYVDRFKLETVTPTEIFIQLSFSRRNDHQFYLMSNERVRVFDKRFLCQPMNTLEHNLDSTDYDMLSMRLINNDLDKIETVCMSSFGRLCFMSFEQAKGVHTFVGQLGEFVNPNSLHMPLQEPSPIEITGKRSDELYGLDVAKDHIFSSSSIAFSVAQLSKEGDICIRGYEYSNEKLKPIKCVSQAKVILEQHKTHVFQKTSRRFNPDLVDTEVHQSVTEAECDNNLFDILDTSLISEAEERLISKRAREKYEQMKKKLRKRF